MASHSLEHATTQEKVNSNFDNVALNIKYLGNKPKVDAAKCIKEAKTTHKLDLSFNRMNIPSKKVWQLSLLKELSLSGNTLTELNSDIMNLPLLETLNLTGNHLTDLPQTLKHCTKLKTILLSANKFNKIPACMSALVNLKRVDFERCQLTQTEGLGALSQCTHLKLSGNSLGTLSDDFCNLRSLVELHIEDNCLRKLPQDFGNLNKLNVINLENNSLTVLPSSMGNCVLLDTLRLRGNPLSEIPNIYAKMTFMTHLDMSEYKLSEIPTSVIPTLTKFKTINLRSNVITSLPPEMVLLDEVSIDLTHNPITGWPIKVRQMQNIKFNWASIKVDDIHE